jgi:hypothetical protein
MGVISQKRVNGYSSPHNGNGRDNHLDAAAPPVGSIVCRLMVPVCWRPLNDAPTAEFVESLEPPNQRVLARVVDAFDLAATELSEEDEAALAPLHHKLNLLIEMIGRTCYGNAIELPPPTRVELGLRELSWATASGAATGDWLTASLYIHPIVLEPLVLCGQVVASEPAEDGAAHRNVLQLSPMGSASAELLGRFVFHENRRNVSVTRNSAHTAKSKPHVRRINGMRRIEAVR